MLPLIWRQANKATIVAVVLYNVVFHGYCPFSSPLEPQDSYTRALKKEGGQFGFILQCASLAPNNRSSSPLRPIKSLLRTGSAELTTRVCDPLPRLWSITLIRHIGIATTWALYVSLVPALTMLRNTSRKPSTGPPSPEWWTNIIR